MVEPICVPNSTLDEEIEKLRQICGEDITISPDKRIQINISFTELKTCSLTFQFTLNDSGDIQYPTEAPAHFELKSNSMPPKMT